jgi:hypothetical protein
MLPSRSRTLTGAPTPIAIRTQHWRRNGDQPRAATTAASVEPATHGTLQSWKEIASELKRGVRTVQRWERELGLPVRRVGTGPRAPVFAFKDELHSWLDTTNSNTNSNMVNHTALLQSLNDFFRTAQRSERGQTCNECGSSIKFLKGQFWIYGTRGKWRVSVPFCPICDTQKLRSFDPASVIQ